MCRFLYRHKFSTQLGTYWGVWVFGSIQLGSTGRGKHSPAHTSSFRGLMLVHWPSEMYLVERSSRQPTWTRAAGNRKKMCIRGKKQTDSFFKKVICNDKNNVQMIANGQIGSEHLFYFHNAKHCLDGCRESFHENYQLIWLQFME